MELNCKPTPFDDTPLDDPTIYRQLVGTLVYLRVTWPDISYVIYLISQFFSAPHLIHLSAVIRILCYIKGTIFQGLHFFPTSSLVLYGYCDADWARDPTEHRSTTYFYLFLGDSFISWHSKQMLLHVLASTLNIVLLSMLHRDYFGYRGYWLIWVSLILLLQFFIMITKVIYEFLIMMFFMSVPNTSNLIVI